MTTEKQAQDFIEIEQGQYWRAPEDIPDQDIPKDVVLLLESIRDVDAKAHTIILRVHPSRMTKYGPKEHCFLVADFLSKFVLEPNYARIRQQEVERIQGRLSELQEELAQAETSAPVPLKGYPAERIGKCRKINNFLPEHLKSLRKRRWFP